MSTDRPTGERHFYDERQPFAAPPHIPRLLRVVDLAHEAAPEGALKHMRTQVHVVEHPDGETGYHNLVNYNDGVSVAPIEIVNGRAYLIMSDQFRMPLPAPGEEHIPMTAKTGAFSREIPSGGVETGETRIDAAIREAHEEVGATIRADQLDLLLPTLYGSVGTNRQPFNIFAAELEDNQWDPATAHADIEEGTTHIAAYRLDTAVPEMIGREVRDLSTTLAIYALYTHTKWRRYAP